MQTQSSSISTGTIEQFVVSKYFWVFVIISVSLTIVTMALTALSDRVSDLPSSPSYFLKYLRDSKLSHTSLSNVDSKFSLDLAKVFESAISSVTLRWK